jgi:hypothetical protein
LNCVDKVKDFFKVCNNVFLKAKPILVNLHMFKAFLLYYMRKEPKQYNTFTVKDILKSTKNEVKDYCGTTDHFTDCSASGLAVVAQLFVGFTDGKRIAATCEA